MGYDLRKLLGTHDTLYKTVKNDRGKKGENRRIEVVVEEGGRVCVPFFGDFVSYVVKEFEGEVKVEKVSLSLVDEASESFAESKGGQGEGDELRGVAVLGCKFLSGDCAVCKTVKGKIIVVEVDDVAGTYKQVGIVELKGGDGAQQQQQRQESDGIEGNWEEIRGKALEVLEGHRERARERKAVGDSGVDSEVGAGGVTNQAQQQQQQQQQRQKKVKGAEGDDDDEDDDLFEKLTAPREGGESDGDGEEGKEGGEDVGGAGKRAENDSDQLGYDEIGTEERQGSEDDRDDARDEDEDEDDDAGGGGGGGSAKNIKEIVREEFERIQSSSVDAKVTGTIQVSSTPAEWDDEGDRKPRIMQWNHVGCLTSSSSARGSSYDVVFRDSGLRRNVTFDSVEDFTIGSLGSRGCVMATDPQDEDDDDAIEEEVNVDVENVGVEVSDRVKESIKRDRKGMRRSGGTSNPTGSTVMFHRFETFGPTTGKDWEITLQSGEGVASAATGEGGGGFVAIATTTGLVRTFTLGGIQTEIFWIPGDAITMVARGRFLAVVYAPRGGSGCRMYKLYDMSRREVVKQGEMSCVRHDEGLKWCGFSDALQFYAMGEAGYLSALSTGNDWTPVLDTVPLKKSRDDTFWPVSVQSSKLVVVPLKGDAIGPDVLNRQVTSALQLRVPIARGGSSDPSQEELLCRANVVANHRAFLDEQDGQAGSDEHARMLQSLDKVILKMFEKSLSSNKVERCADLCERLSNEVAFDIALALCDQADISQGVRRGLIDRVKFAKESMIEEAIMDEGDDEGYFYGEGDASSPRDRPVLQPGAGASSSNVGEDDSVVDETAGYGGTPPAGDDREGGLGDERGEAAVAASAASSQPDRNRVTPIGLLDSANDASVPLGLPSRSSMSSSSSSPVRLNPFCKKTFSPNPKGSRSSAAGGGGRGNSSSSNLEDMLSPSPMGKPQLSRKSTFSEGSRIKSKRAKRII